MNKWNERPEKETEGGINIKNKMSVATHNSHCWNFTAISTRARAQIQKRNQY